MKSKSQVLFLAVVGLFLALVAVTQTYASPDAALATPRPSRTPRPTATPKIIIVEITEAQFYTLFKVPTTDKIEKVTVDIVEGQLVIVDEFAAPESSIMLMRIGSNVVKNKVVIELGSFELNGFTVSAADLRKAAPDTGPIIDRYNVLLKNLVARQIARKVSGRYTIQSAVFTQDKLVITIVK